MGMRMTMVLVPLKAPTAHGKPKGEGGGMRGFDLVVLKGDKIVLNEVYVHQLSVA